MVMDVHARVCRVWCECGLYLLTSLNPSVCCVDIIMRCVLAAVLCDVRDDAMKRFVRIAFSV